MKNLIITILCIASLSSCKTMKINRATGDKHPTANTKHFQKVYGKYGGFHTGKGFIALPGETVIINKKH